MRAAAGICASGSVAAVLVAVACAASAVNACEAREPTRATGPGPHDFSALPAQTRLWQEDDGGEPLSLRARVLDTCGGPVAGAQVRILHANHHGEHEPGRWRAELTADAGGAFQVLTVLPGYAGGLPRHIHFIVDHPAHQRLVTRLFFKNDPAMDHGIEDLAMVLEEVQRGDGRGWVAGYEFVLAPR